MQKQLRKNTKSSTRKSWAARGLQPIPGYRLIEKIGHGGCGEVWKCEAPGGLEKAVKFIRESVFDLTNRSIEQELAALEHIKLIRHPFLISIERIEIVDGQLLVVMELADRTLYDLFLEYQQGGFPGIPRRELLGYLREAAEALDLINFQHGLQHLDTKPHNLFVLNNHVKLADFGVARKVAELHSDRDAATGGHLAAGGTLPYCAPEVLLGKISRRSDQYSLAIVYQELTTGTLPFNGKYGRQLYMQHLQMEPDLSILPKAERAILRRALAKDPQQRFSSCTQLIQSLQSLGDPVAEVCDQTDDATACESTTQSRSHDRTRSIGIAKTKLLSRRDVVNELVRDISTFIKNELELALGHTAQKGGKLEEILTAKLPFGSNGLPPDEFWRSWNAEAVVHRMKLVFRSNTESRIETSKTPNVLFIGRDDSCHIWLDREGVQGIHALMTPTPRGLMVCDLKSHTGTTINDQSIQRGCVHDKDELGIGPVTMTVQMPKVELTSASPADAMRSLSYAAHFETAATWFIRGRRSFWGKWRRGDPGLRVALHLLQPANSLDRLTTITLAIEAVRCPKKQAIQMLENVGVPMMQQLRQLVQGDSDDRKIVRWPFPLSVDVTDYKSGRLLHSLGKDISYEGIGLYVPPDHPLSGKILIHLLRKWQGGDHGEENQRVAVPADIIRVQPISNGWFEIGGRFV